MPQAASLTPMFRQYRALKQDHPNAILLFRMGDFYEMFHEDANEASRLLDLTLTTRGKGTAHAAPMCGFPHHQLDAYAARLVQAGRRVAICDQVEDPRKAKGLVRREVVRIVTPGTVTDPDQLEAKENAWLAGVAVCAGRVGAAFLDASTGEFLAWEAPDGAEPWKALSERLEDFSPREIVHGEDLTHTEGLRRPDTTEVVLTATDPYAFLPETAADTLLRHFGVVSLDGFGLTARSAATAAAGGLLLYAAETQRCDLRHVDAVVVHEPASHLLLDPATRRNLEIDRSIRDGTRRGSLLDAIDETLTSPGGRMLRSRLLAPLTDPRAIRARLAAVGELVDRPELRREARERLRGVQDVERLLARTVTGTAGPRDLLALRRSLERLPGLKEGLADLSSELAREVLDGLDPCADVAELLSRAIVDDPPAGLRDGGVIRDGWNAELDELRAIRKDGRGTIAAIEAREREATGIASLKVRYNKVFGYYIEVSRANLRLVPDGYERKQTIANGERYVTAELKEHEAKIIRAQERIEEIEAEVFAGVRTEVGSHATRIKAAARAVAQIDVVSALAEAAVSRGYRCPVINDGPSLRVAGGRHPVVERSLAGERFVANDTSLGGEAPAIAILTGPNMGGKSTYLRQVAQIALLAQAGSFVPADEAEVGVVDRIFCRVGASDSLAGGQSTFMVEMAETANILHHATPRSLVLLDEIGRGTSTFDGMAIAWAVVEHLHGAGEGPPRTLFATHYHELTELAVTLPGVANLRMSVREWGERVVFLHRVEPGAADRSYGIHVARLAGVPNEVVARAREILDNLERDEFGRDGLPRRARRGGTEPPAGQRGLFGGEAPTTEPDPLEEAGGSILAEIREIVPDRTTPLEALETIARWRGRLVDAEGDPSFRKR